MQLGERRKKRCGRPELAAAWRLVTRRVGPVNRHFILAGWPQETPEQITVPALAEMPASTKHDFTNACQVWDGSESDPLE